ncbi:hypothetical protein ASF70_12685 [Rhizobium sp. Leaf321]|uniref:DNA cytosine methyltransferase n=1 Tax=Rhizobium sp. Leaf321 TaxID=1736335 RepID=UPI0007139322|nr:DNA cytosine methyltransferase [Rhizobium sp. Leaf321]KQQ72384.1 hypothetical protein ASF70_12685 [Rhizobium sp. Leaf321]
MRVLSTFSGISAASVAWKHQGFQIVGYCEPSPFQSHVLNQRCGATSPKYLPAAKGFEAKKYSGITGGTVINFGDIEQITDDDLRALGPVDILEGGSPCQSFSIAGFRGGLSDSRGNLMLAFARLALRMKEINKLKLVVWENGKGVLSDETNGFGCLLGALAGGRPPVEPPGRGFTTAGHLLVGRPEEPLEEVTIAWRVLDSQRLGVAQRRERVFVVCSYDPAIDAGAVLFESEGEGWSAETRGGTEEDPAGSSEGRVGGLIWPPVVGTLNASAAGMSRTAGQGNELDFVIITHGGKVVRRPTPLECERLQGFPDGYTDVWFEGRPAEDHHRYRGLGNSMTVQAMEYIGHRINLIQAEAYPLRVAA